MIKSLERILGYKVLSTAPVSGGNISDSQKVVTSQGQYFVKISKEGVSQFREEAAGLRALAEAEKLIAEPDDGRYVPLRVPSVFHADDHFLVLEWIDTKEPNDVFWENFGIALARLHHISGDHFGFETNNHIGSTPQTNPRREYREISWGEYFIEYRLLPMITHSNLSVVTLLQLEFQKALPRIRKTLSSVKEKPCLVHGDLWGGNFMCDTDGRAVLVDPAPYYGHREVDLAMTELFGGFDPKFYEAYRNEYPLPADYEKRRAIYNLYHLLNHWIIFGAASYRERTMTALKNI
jgi:fructosamine-3-kinase